MGKIGPLARFLRWLSGLLARFLRWLSNLLWPGDYDKDFAKTAYRAYLVEKDPERLDAAIERFQLAVDQYRKDAKSPLQTTLVNLAVAVWTRYEDCGRSPEDLYKVISLNTEVWESWSGDKHTKTYLLVLGALGRAYFEQYQGAFWSPPIKPDEKQQAFEKGLQYYTELKHNAAAAGMQRITAQIQLGIMFRTRCDLENTQDGFEFGFQHLQDALIGITDASKEVGEGDEQRVMKAELNDTRGTCLLNLAESYEIRYEREKDPRNTHDLAKAIDSNTKAKGLLKAGSQELPACLYNLARQLRLRWIQTLDETDYDKAREMAQAAQQIEHAGERLEDIAKLLAVLEPPGPPSRQETVDFGETHTVGALSRQATLYATSNNLQAPQRRSTVTSMDVRTAGSPSRQATLYATSNNDQTPQRRDTVTSMGMRTVGAPSRQGTLSETSNVQTLQRWGTVTSLHTRAVGAPSRQGTVHDTSHNVGISQSLDSSEPVSSSPVE